jgi:SAM-dependent methyltransferase
MIANSTAVGDWDQYLDSEFAFLDYPPGARVLDVGFGEGTQMRRLITRGCLAIGIEFDERLAERAGARGLLVLRARAESLPFASASFDGLVCEVVIPYTDEALAIREVARVLRPGAIARLSYHGLGYSLRSLLTRRHWKERVYNARVIVNTWVYAISGRRLPGFVGDTLYQTRRRLRRHYRQSGLELIEERRQAHFAGAPVFMYHSVRRPDSFNPGRPEPGVGQGRQ